MAEELLVALAEQLGKLPNHISIEGHTDAKPYATNRDYGNWELSTDRANSARRIMQATGLRADQISQVRGYADQKLRVPGNPLEPSNRRISLIVQYVVKNDEDEPASVLAGGRIITPRSRTEARNRTRKAITEGKPGQTGAAITRAWTDLSSEAAWPAKTSIG